MLQALPGGAAGVCDAGADVRVGFFIDTFEIIFIVVPIFGPVLIKMGVDPCGSA
ncbi:MAG: TRAP transporter large permease subunit [Burkholderiaceae bacterium]